MDLPLFPLRSVLFPGGHLKLQVFDSRHLALLQQCQQQQTLLGVVCLKEQAPETVAAGSAAQSSWPFQCTGVLAQVLGIDSGIGPITPVRCQGLERFEVQQAHLDSTGLWQAQVQRCPDEPCVAPPINLLDAVRALASAIGSLKLHGGDVFIKPLAFDNAGWVANRWCELLPIPMAAKYQLMALPDPLARLKLVAEFLRSKDLVR
jgi:uncharacterized protein